MVSNAGDRKGKVMIYRALKNMSLVLVVVCRSCSHLSVMEQHECGTEKDFNCLD